MSSSVIEASSSSLLPPQGQRPASKNGSSSHLKLQQLLVLPSISRSSLKTKVSESSRRSPTHQSSQHSTIEGNSIATASASGAANISIGTTFESNDESCSLNEKTTSMMSSNKNHLYSQLSKVRRLRNITDEGRLLLANRVNLLKKEEEEVQRKVEELVRKSENVLLAKFRHEKEIAKREQTAREEEERLRVVQQLHLAKRTKDRSERLSKITEQVGRTVEECQRLKQVRALSVSKAREHQHHEKAEQLNQISRVREKSFIQRQRAQSVEASSNDTRLLRAIEAEEDNHRKNIIKLAELAAAEQKLLSRLKRSKKKQDRAITKLEKAIRISPEVITFQRLESMETRATKEASRSLSSRAAETHLNKIINIRNEFQGEEHRSHQEQQQHQKQNPMQVQPISKNQLSSINPHKEKKKQAKRLLSEESIRGEKLSQREEGTQVEHHVNVLQQLDRANLQAPHSGDKREVSGNVSAKKVSLQVQEEEPSSSLRRKERSAVAAIQKENVVGVEGHKSNDAAKKKKEKKKREVMSPFVQESHVPSIYDRSLSIYTKQQKKKLQRRQSSTNTSLNSTALSLPEMVFR